MSAKMLKSLSILVLVIGGIVTIIISVGAIGDNEGTVPYVLTILNAVNITLFLGMLLLGLSYTVNGSGKISLHSAITVATSLRFMIGAHICILFTNMGLQIAEYGINTLSEVGAFLWSIFMTAVFASLLYVLSNQIAKLGRGKAVN